MIRYYFYVVLLPLVALAAMQPENVLAKHCLKNYSNTYLSQKDYKAFVYAPLSDAMGKAMKKRF